MKKRKTIVVCVFLALIALTAIHTVVSAVKSYQYDMDLANGVDILEGFGAVLTIMVGGFVILYELDLFYTVFYFFVKPKTVAKSILNILSNLSLLLLFFAEYYKDVFKEDMIAPLIVVFMYALLRILYFMISTRGLTQEQ